jgi:hypothetical protein
MRSLLILLVLLVSLSACASDVPRRLEQAEQAFDTDGPITRLFHSSLYYPSEIRLQHDGFLVGIEKSPRARIAGGVDIPTAGAVNSGLDKGTAQQLLNDRKVMFVSHVLQSQEGVVPVCAIYNAYGFQGVPQLVAPCPEAMAAGQPTQAYQRSWDVLDNLRAALDARLAGPTHYSHVLVITMGWNTDQEEAVRNFNSLVNAARSAASPEFKPLVIGVTWPSKWVSAWLDPVFKLASFPNKSHDADELGVTWLGVLLHDTLAPARTRGIPVIAIGHSFGSRAMSVAACVGPVIYREVPLVRARIDHLVNWQGAFKSDRLFGEGSDGFYYPSHCPAVGNFVLTASSHDEAVKKPFWGTYAGELKSYAETCAAKKARCARVETTGLIGPVLGSNDSGLLYLDASDLIRENAFGTGGGAHSDIYRAEHGRMLLQATGIAQASAKP